jgi:hypothetical protein
MGAADLRDSPLMVRDVGEMPRSWPVISLKFGIAFMMA